MFMNLNTITGDLTPAMKRRIVILAIVTAVTIGINVAGIFPELGILLANLLYFPLILAACWYPKRCYLFLIFIAVIYVFFIPNFSHTDDFIQNIVRLSGFFIFALVGVIVSVLSYNLRNTETQLNDIIDSLPDATFVVNKDGVVTAWNKAAEKLTGVKKADILGKGNYEHAFALYGERRPALIDLVMKSDPEIESHYPNLENDDGRFSADVRIPHFRGNSGVYLHLAAIALKDKSGNIKGGIESLRDVTDNIITESALNNTTKKLNTISGIIRTDLSNKLAVLYGYLRIGAVKFDDPDVISFIKDIKKATVGIERQLGISRGFRAIGTKPPAWVPVQQAAMEAAGKVDLGRIYFRPWTERLEIFADPHLPTALYHLLDNSANLRGDVTKIVLTYQLREDGCALIYEDNGPGIPDIDKNGLFNRDSDESYGRGLFLTLDIISITGIKITETGIPGKGARFELLIPSEGYRIR